MLREDIRTKIRLVESDGFVEWDNRRNKWIKVIWVKERGFRMEYTRAFLRETSLRVIKRMVKADMKRLIRLLKGGK